MPRKTFLLIALVSLVSLGGVAAPRASHASELPPELVFVPDAGVRIYDAGQPAPVLMEDGSICLFYNIAHGPNTPGRREVACSEDGLTFPEEGQAPHSVEVINPFAVRLPDGMWRLYAMNEDTGIMTSRRSADGVRFAPEDGVRYTAPPEHLPLGVRDFFVNADGDVIFLYIGHRDGEDAHIRLAVSTDGGDTFTLHTDDPLGDLEKDDRQDRNVDPKFTPLPDGGARLFTMVPGVVPIPGQRACCVVASFTTPDGYTYTPDPGVRLRTDDFTEFAVWSLNDPWVIRLPDGRFRMYVAGLLAEKVGQGQVVILSATTPPVEP